VTASIPDGAECACCGRDVDEDELVRLAHRPEIAICRGCVESLPSRRDGLLRAVPVLATSDLAASVAFWKTAGFDVSQYGDDFASAHREGIELHLVAPPGQGRDRGAAYLHVRGVDPLRQTWAAAGLPASEVRDQPWGMREFEIVDPGGNVVRIGQNL
jgi:hypothetical protein